MQERGERALGAKRFEHDEHAARRENAMHLAREALRVRHVAHAEAAHRGGERSVFERQIARVGDERLGARRFRVTRAHHLFGEIDGDDALARRGIGEQLRKSIVPAHTSRRGPRGARRSSAHARRRHV